MTDRKEIKRDQVWLTKSGRKLTVLSTTMPNGDFCVLAWAPHEWLNCRLIWARLDGTVNSRPGVAHPDDFVELLS